MFPEPGQGTDGLGVTGLGQGLPQGLGTGPIPRPAPIPRQLQKPRRAQGSAIGLQDRPRPVEIAAVAVPAGHRLGIGTYVGRVGQGASEGGRQGCQGQEVEAVVA